MKYHALLIIFLFFYGSVKPSIFEITSSWINFSSENLITYVYKKFEWCTNDEVPYQLYNLQRMFNERLYGQHIATDIVLNAIISHVKNKKPKKPLVMSFHGANGIGKSYVSRIIAKALYEKGDNSAYFHFYYSLHNFPLTDRISEYQNQLQKDIENAINKCEKSLFIFDGIEEMPSDLLKVLMPFIDCRDCGKNKKINKNKSIFLFLTNAGSFSIQRHLIEKLSIGLKRESTTLQDFEKLIISETFNRTGGLFQSILISSDSIDFYVPFLPLEKQHVTYCIQEAFQELKIPATKNLIEQVLQELRFGPQPENLFSNSGCKRVSQITGRIVTKLYLNYDFSNAIDSNKDDL